MLGRPIREEHLPLFGRHPRVRLGRMVAPPPEDEPEHAQGARDEEGGTPAAQLRVEKRHEHDGDGGPEGGAAVEERHRPSPLAPGEPLRDRLGRARPVGRLARAEQETEGTEAAQPAREGREHGRERVPQHAERQPVARADPVEEAAHHRLAHRVGEAERDDHEREALVRPVELLLQVGAEDAEGLPVEIVDHGGEEK